MRYPLILSIFLIALLSACSDSDNATQIDPMDNETSMPTDNGDNENHSLAPAGLNGTWQLDCRIDDIESSSPEYVITKSTFEDDVVTIKNDYFDDETCSTPSTATHTAVDSIVFSGTTDTVQGTASNADFTRESATFNGTTITENLDDETLLDILFVDGDQLFSGLEVDDATDSSEPQRPTTLDLQNVFERQ